MLDTSNSSYLVSALEEKYSISNAFNRGFVSGIHSVAISASKVSTSGFRHRAENKPYTIVCAYISANCFSDKLICRASVKRLYSWKVRPALDSILSDSSMVDAISNAFSARICVKL